MKKQKQLDTIRYQINAAISICQPSEKYGLLVDDPKLYLEEDETKDIYRKMEEYAQTINHDVDHWSFFPISVNASYNVVFIGLPVHPNAKPEPSTDVVERYFFNLPLIHFV